MLDVCNCSMGIPKLPDRPPRASLTHAEFFLVWITTRLVDSLRGHSSRLLIQNGFSRVIYVTVVGGDAFGKIRAVVAYPVIKPSAAFEGMGIAVDVSLEAELSVFRSDPVFLRVDSYHPCHVKLAVLLVPGRNYLVTADGCFFHGLLAAKWCEVTAYGKKLAASIWNARPVKR